MTCTSPTHTNNDAQGASPIYSDFLTPSKHRKFNDWVKYTLNCWIEKVVPHESGGIEAGVCDPSSIRLLGSDWGLTQTLLTAVTNICHSLQTKC